MDERGDKDYEYRGKTYRLPGELLAIQIQWAKADAACHAAVADGDDEALNRHRGERLHWTMEKVRRAQPWRDSFENYERWIADEALKQAGREVAAAGQ